MGEGQEEAKAECCCRLGQTDARCSSFQHATCSRYEKCIDFFYQSLPKIEMRVFEKEKEKEKGKGKEMELRRFQIVGFLKNFGFIILGYSFY